MATDPAKGVTMFGNQWETQPTFAETEMQLDFLTRPTALLELGIDKDAQVADRARDADQVFIAAYPRCPSALPTRRPAPPPTAKLFCIPASLLGRVPATKLCCLSSSLLYDLFFIGNTTSKKVMA